MVIIRPVKDGDALGLVELAKQAGDGLTTLPPDLKVMEERIASSQKSFAKNISQPGQEYYFLVMEDIETQKIVGTSAIFATVGLDKPFYNYKILHITQASQDPPLKVDTRVLSLSNDYRGATELATLFLAPTHREGGNGSLLSRTRYLLMASNPKRFSETVMAELRGWTDENDQSPFWNSVGKHFFQMEFAEADLINGRGNSQFIADLMPKYPIYTNLLPQAAREAIGKPNDKTMPAMKILEKEGFRFRGSVDIFDGGPCLEVSLQNIKSVNKTQTAIVKSVDDSLNGERYIISNPLYNEFRAMYGEIEILNSENLEVSITRKCAENLGVEPGSTIQILTA